jgi:glycosyltransferase involved in cell wall biosynthesis
MADVTVLMTVYNGMPYLPAAVESVLRQTLSDVRLVIVNDGSTDTTVDYLNRLSADRVTVLHQENQGTAAAANHGFAHCHTEFTARMDADDMSLPERLAAERDFLVAHPDVGLVGTQITPLGEKKIGRSLTLPTDHDEIYASLLAGRHALAHSSIMFRTQLLRDIGGYWSLPLVDDWDMMLRMGEAAEVANLDELLHQYRVHPGSLNGSAMSRMRLSIDFACELARRRRTGEPPISPDEFQTHRDARPAWQRGWDRLQCYALGQYRMAVAELCGHRPVRGRARLAWAAACAPGLTAHRLARILRH